MASLAKVTGARLIIHAYKYGFSLISSYGKLYGICNLLIVPDSVYDNVLYDNVVYDNALSDNVVYDNVVFDNIVYDNIVYDNVVHDNARWLWSDVSGQEAQIQNMTKCIPPQI